MVTVTANSLTANAFGLNPSSSAASSRATKEVTGNLANPANRLDLPSNEPNPGAQRGAENVGAFGAIDTAAQRRISSVINAVGAKASLSATQFGNTSRSSGINSSFQPPSAEELQLAQLVIFDQSSSRATATFNQVGNGLNDDRGGLIDVYA